MPTYSKFRPAAPLQRHSDLHHQPRFALFSNRPCGVNSPTHAYYVKENEVGVKVLGAKTVRGVTPGSILHHA